MIKKLLGLTLTLLAMCCVILACELTPKEPEKTRLQKAIKTYCHMYDVDEFLFSALVHVESGHIQDQYKYRNDWTILHTQEWVKTIIKTCRANGKKLNDRDGWVFCSLGDSQILYLVAVGQYGYQGTPQELMENVETNIRYGVRYFADLRLRYVESDKCTLYAISAYNAGHVSFRFVYDKAGNGRYQFKNQFYVDSVMTNFKLLCNGGTL